MNKFRIAFGVIFTWLFTSYAQVPKKAAPVGLNMREGIEWCQMRHMNASQDQLPRILLVGDSITAGYSYPVNALLNDVAYCSWMTTSRCMGDPVFDEELALILGQYPYAVIYFNNGLHGAPFSDAQYEQATARVFSKLADTGAAVIWRDSTEVNPSMEDDVMRGRIERRNAIAHRYAAKHKFLIDNVGSFDAESYQDKLHFKTDTVKVQAEHVVATVESALNANGE